MKTHTPAIGGREMDLASVAESTDAPAFGAAEVSPCQSEGGAS
jgi:hypothetical protein